MRKILVTGGAGFIGSALAEGLLKNKDNYVVILDNLTTGHLKKLPIFNRNGKFIKLDVNKRLQLGDVMMTYKFDYVFHYAAVVGVKNTLENPIKVLDDINGFKHILDLSKNTGVKRVFFSSSSEIYGEPVEYPQNENTTPLNSRLPYAIVKNVGEAYLKSFNKEYGLEYTIFRFFNTYGPKQSKNFVMSKFISKALKDEDITIYGDGSQTRTFCFINDNIEACLSAFYNDKYINDVINVGGDIEIKIVDLAKTIIKLAKSKSKIVHLPALEEGDMRGRRPDITKMKKLLSHDLLPIEEGIKETLKKGLLELNQ